MSKTNSPVAPEPTPDHSVPYPEAPEVDHNDESQEHYRGARDPELAKPPVPPVHKNW